MPRIRSIKPEFWQDEKLATLDPVTRLVFLGLISMADDKGRLVDSIKMIDGFIFPLTDDSSRAALEFLANLSRIIRYVGPSGQPLIQVANWERHQKVSHPNPYALPAPQLELLEGQRVAKRSRAAREPLPNRAGEIPATINDLRSINNPAEAAGAAGSNGKRPPTWLTPYGQAWTDRFGGEPNWDLLAKALAKPRKKHGDETLLPAWRRFLDASDIRYVNVHKFASGLGVWLGEAPAGPLLPTVPEMEYVDE